MDKDDALAVRGCVCANIRRTDRAITQFYDAILAPSGLHMTQFNLLANISEAAPLIMNRLAEQMMMDRTTLTRNLGPLVKQGWVLIQEGEDRRTRQITLTMEGEVALAHALPLWKEAHAHMLRGLGSQHVETLLSELSTVVLLSH